jgi:flagellar biosynthesis/type III secretory pathway protein FliH
MLNQPLEPLALKSFAREKEVTPFPYSELAAKLVETKEPDRLRQLEEMLSENKERSAELEREAYDKAYAAGEKSGLALGEKRAEQILLQMQQMLDASESQMGEIHRAMSEAVVDISGALCEWLIGEITENERGRLLEMAKKTAHTLPEMGPMTLAVNPDDFAQFEKLLAESKMKSPLIADANVARGCIRIFSKAQDVLIDPSTSIAEGLAYIKAELLSDEPFSKA